MGSEGADGAVGRAAGEAGDFALTSAEGMPMNSTSGKRPSLELMTRASLHQSRNWVVNTSRLNRSQNVMGSVSKDGRKERVSGVPISMRFLRFRMMARSFSSSATGHQMILRASASDMPITSWRQALHEGEKKTRAVVSSSIPGA